MDHFMIQIVDTELWVRSVRLAHPAVREAKLQGKARLVNGTKTNSIKISYFKGNSSNQQIVATLTFPKQLV